MNERATPPPPIDVRGLSVSYGERQALVDVSLTVPAGTIVGLLGPNGSGKSTLLSTVVGLRTPVSGEVRVFGEPTGPLARRRIGIVFQETTADRLMTLRETLSLHGRLFGLGGGRLQRRIDELLDRFGLADRAKDTVTTLSGGLRRRLELARALLPAPDVLLLDEPTTGLDPDARRDFWQRLQAAHETGMTLLLATNDVAEAERQCDIVAFLHRGRLIAQGTPAKLKESLRHDSVLIGCADGQTAKLSAAIETWPGVGAVRLADSLIHVTVDDASSFLPRLFQTTVGGIREIHIEESTLEDAYFQIAGASLQSRQREEAL